MFAINNEHAGAVAGQPTFFWTVPWLPWMISERLELMTARAEFSEALEY